jgi:hypothetical protein
VWSGIVGICVNLPVRQCLVAGSSLSVTRVRRPARYRRNVQLIRSPSGRWLVGLVKREKTDLLSLKSVIRRKHSGWA